MTSNRVLQIEVRIPIKEGESCTLEDSFDISGTVFNSLIDDPIFKKIAATEPAPELVMTLPGSGKSKWAWPLVADSTKGRP